MIVEIAFQLLIIICAGRRFFGFAPDDHTTMELRRPLCSVVD